jgi:hypothetical protein
MSLRTCGALSRISADFFSSEYDKPPHKSGVAVRLTTVREMRNCALSDCPFCAIVLATAKPSFWSKGVLDNMPVILERTTIDPEQSFLLTVGMDSSPRSFFYRVPAEWSASRCKSVNDFCR